MSDAELLSPQELVAMIRRNAAGKPPVPERRRDDATSVSDREGTPEQGWTEDLGDVAGLIRPIGTNKVVRKGDRVRRYNAENNTFTEIKIVDTPEGKRFNVVGCFFIVDPFHRDPVEERKRIAAYWARVASGDIVLDERPGCQWCAYGIPVKNDPRFPDLISNVICANRDIIAGLTPRERNEASMRCTPALHFKPSGVHSFAAEYLGWKPDPECIARMERMVRPPRQKEDVVENHNVPESHTLALQRHHGFWDDVDIDRDGDRPVKGGCGAATRGRPSAGTSPKKRSQRRR